MKTILTSTIQGNKVYLNHQGLATDRIDHAECFRDHTDASLKAVKINSDEGWSKWGVAWFPEQVLFSEEQQLINEWVENEKPKCKSHR